MSSKRLPTVVSDIPKDLRIFLDRVREAFDSAAFMSQDDLKSLIKREATGGGGGDAGGGGGSGPDGSRPCGDTVYPTAPTGLEADGAFTVIMLEWDVAPYCGHAFTEIWAAQVDDLGQADLIGQTVGVLYTHAVREGSTYYYWIRFVNDKGVRGPFNATAGTKGETGRSPEYLLGLLTGEITETQLYKDLGERIDLIDGPVGRAGTVNERIREEVDKLANGVTDITVTTDTGTTTLRALKASTENNAAAILTEQTVRADADGVLAASLNALVAKVNDPQTGLEKTYASVLTEQTARATADTALANSLTTLTATVNDPTTGLAKAHAAIAAEQTARATADTAITSQVNQAVSRIDGNVSAIQQTMTTTVSKVDGLSAQYTVKIDQNGYVSGFGLASTAPVNGTPTSAFAVRADRFYIAAPTLPSGQQTKIPFVVQTTQTTINGETVHPGVYMDSAWIVNGSITSAKIANATIVDAKIASLSASKITAGTINVGIVIKSVGYDTGNWGFMIDAASGNCNFRNGTFNGNVYAVDGKFTGALFGGDATGYSSGVGFFSGADGGTRGNSSTYRWRVGNPYGARIQWNGSAVEVYNSSNQLTLSSGGVTWSQIASKPTTFLTSTEQTKLNKTDNLKGLAYQDSVFVGSTVKFSDGTTMGVGDFVNRLSRITATNIGTFMDAAAIGSAYIGNAAIDTAHIRDLSVDTIKIRNGAVSRTVGGPAYSYIPGFTIYMDQPGTVIVMATANFLAQDTSMASGFLHASLNGIPGPTVGVSMYNFHSSSVTAIGKWDVGAGAHWASGFAWYTNGFRTLGTCGVVAFGLQR